MSYQCSRGRPWSWRSQRTAQDFPHSQHTMLSLFCLFLLNWTLGTSPHSVRFSSISSTSRLLDRTSCPYRLFFRIDESPFRPPLEITRLSVRLVECSISIPSVGRIFRHDWRPLVPNERFLIFSGADRSRLRCYPGSIDTPSIGSRSITGMRGCHSKGLSDMARPTPCANLEQTGCVL
jgi:hypothetical protein